MSRWFPGKATATVQWPLNPAIPPGVIYPPSDRFRSAERGISSPQQSSTLSEQQQKLLKSCEDCFVPAFFSFRSLFLKVYYSTLFVLKLNANCCTPKSRWISCILKIHTYKLHQVQKMVYNSWHEDCAWIWLQCLGSSQWERCDYKSCIYLCDKQDFTFDLFLCIIMFVCCIRKTPMSIYWDCGK